MREALPFRCCCCCFDISWPKASCPEPKEGVPVELFVPNSECPNPGTDGDEPDKVDDPGPEPNTPVAAGDTENIDALNGLAAPAAPVACGRRPTPRDDVPKPPDVPVGWALSAPVG